MNNTLLREVLRNIFTKRATDTGIRTGTGMVPILDIAVMKIESKCMCKRNPP